MGFQMLYKLRKLVFKNDNYKDKEWLENEYLINLKSSIDIAEECGVWPVVIVKYLNIFNISIRNKKSVETIEKMKQAKLGKKMSNETKLKMKQSWVISRKYRSGKYSFLWKDGRSFEKYCPNFNNYSKKFVRDMFNRTCFICGKDELENNEQLCIHHIDYNKMQGCNNKFWHLIPLCRTCHNSTNTHRWFWFNLLHNYTIMVMDNDLCQLYDIEIYRICTKGA